MTLELKIQNMALVMQCVCYDEAHANAHASENNINQDFVLVIDQPVQVHH